MLKETKGEAVGAAVAEKTQVEKDKENLAKRDKERAKKAEAFWKELEDTEGKEKAESVKKGMKEELKKQKGQEEVVLKERKDQPTSEEKLAAYIILAKEEGLKLGDFEKQGEDKWKAKVLVAEEKKAEEKKKDEKIDGNIALSKNPKTTAKVTSDGDKSKTPDFGPLTPELRSEAIKVMVKKKALRTGKSEEEIEKALKEKGEYDQLPEKEPEEFKQALDYIKEKDSKPEIRWVKDDDGYLHSGSWPAGMTEGAIKAELRKHKSRKQKEKEGFRVKGIKYEGEQQGEAQIKLPDKITAVSMEAQVEFMATQRANKRLRDMINKSGFIKRSWYQNMEQGYRERLIEEERNKILGLQKKPGFFQGLIKGRDQKRLRDRGEENLYGDDALLNQSRKEQEALVTRFQDNFIRESEGEVKRVIDAEHSSEEELEAAENLKFIIERYATNETITDEQFTEEKHAILDHLKQLNPALFDQGQMMADNFLETARQFRAAYKQFVEMGAHGEHMAELDEQTRREMAALAKIKQATGNLQVSFGISKPAVKTEEKGKVVDWLTKQAQRNSVTGNLLTPTKIGFAVSIGTYLSQRPASWLLGAVGATGIAAALRRNRQLNTDIASHRQERAMGETGSTEGMRGRFDREVVYDMRRAADIEASIVRGLAELRKEPDPELREKLVKDVVDAEARMSLSETRKLDLLQWEGETQLERNRLGLMRQVAEAKVFLGISDELLQRKIDIRKTQLEAGIRQTNKEVLWYKTKESFKAAAIGATIGLVVGASTQQALAELGFRPGGRMTGLEKLNSWLSGEHLSDLSKDMGLHVDGNVPNVQIPSDMHWEIDKATPGKFLLMDKSGGFHGSIVTTGEASHFTPAGGEDMKFVNLPMPEMQTNKTMSSLEWMRSTGLGRHVQYDSAHPFYDNNTPGIYEKNELGLWYGGKNNTGFTQDGNFQFDLSHIKEGGSLSGNHQANIESLISQGKLKVLIIPEGGHPNDGIMIDVGSDHMATTKGNQTEMAKHLFELGSNGKTEFHGHRVQLVEIVKSDSGTETIRSLATVKGDGSGVASFEVSMKNSAPTGVIFPGGADKGNWAMPVIPVWVNRQRLESRDFVTGKTIAPEVADRYLSANQLLIKQLGQRPRAFTMETGDGRLFDVRLDKTSLWGLEVKDQIEALGNIQEALRNFNSKDLDYFEIRPETFNHIGSRGDWISVDARRDPKEIAEWLKKALKEARTKRITWLKSMKDDADQNWRVDWNDASEMARRILQQPADDNAYYPPLAWLRAIEMMEGGLEKPQDIVYERVYNWSSDKPDEFYKNYADALNTKQIQELPVEQQQQIAKMLIEVLPKIEPGLFDDVLIMLRTYTEKDKEITEDGNVVHINVLEKDPEKFLKTLRWRLQEAKRRREERMGETQRDRQERALQGFKDKFPSGIAQKIVVDPSFYEQMSDREQQMLMRIAKMIMDDIGIADLQKSKRIYLSAEAPANARLGDIWFTKTRFHDSAYADFVNEVKLGLAKLENRQGRPVEQEDEEEQQQGGGETEERPEPRGKITADRLLNMAQERLRGNFGYEINISIADDISDQELVRRRTRFQKFIDKLVQYNYLFNRLPEKVDEIVFTTDNRDIFEEQKADQLGKTLYFSLEAIDNTGKFERILKSYLSGKGVEVPSDARRNNQDRASVEQLRNAYREKYDFELPNVDVVWPSSVKTREEREQMLAKISEVFDGIEPEFWSANATPLSHVTFGPRRYQDKVRKSTSGNSLERVVYIPYQDDVAAMRGLLKRLLERDRLIKGAGPGEEVRGNTAEDQERMRQLAVGFRQDIKSFVNDVYQDSGYEAPELKVEFANSLSRFDTPDSLEQKLFYAQQALNELDAEDWRLIDKVLVTHSASEQHAGDRENILRVPAGLGLAEMTEKIKAQLNAMVEALPEDERRRREASISLANNIINAVRRAGKPGSAEQPSNQVDSNTPAEKSNTTGPVEKPNTPTQKRVNNRMAELFDGRDLNKMSRAELKGHEQYVKAVQSQLGDKKKEVPGITSEVDKYNLDAARKLAKSIMKRIEKASARGGVEGLSTAQVRKLRSDVDRLEESYKKLEPLIRE